MRVDAGRGSALVADDAGLLAECDVHTYRASGPGGQKRNKTESAVRLHHTPTGIRVIAEESRSQHENRARALRRLRKAIALRVREPTADEGVPAALDACMRNGRIDVGRRDRRWLPAAAAALDLLQACQGSVGDVARRLGVTTGNLSSFLTGDEDLLVEANRVRAAHGLKALR